MDFLLIPLVVMLAPVLIVLIVLRYRYLQTQAQFGALLALADKGVDLGSQWLQPSAADVQRRHGLVLVGGGLGLMMMFLALPGGFDSGLAVSQLWGIGLLPLATGLGYLASAYLDRRDGVRG